MHTNDQEQLAGVIRQAADGFDLDGDQEEPGAVEEADFEQDDNHIMNDEQNRDQDRAGSSEIALIEQAQKESLESGAELEEALMEAAIQESLQAAELLPEYHQEQVSINLSPRRHCSPVMCNYLVSCVGLFIGAAICCVFSTGCRNRMQMAWSYYRTNQSLMVGYMPPPKCFSWCSSTARPSPGLVYPYMPDHCCWKRMTAAGNDPIHMDLCR